MYICNPSTSNYKKLNTYESHGTENSIHFTKLVFHKNPT